jgi:hypothetical protein
MVPGPGVGGVPLQPRYGFARRLHQRVLEGKGSLGSDRSQTTERADMHELRALLAG